MDDKQPSDEILLQHIARQDAEALAELYDRYAQIVYNLIVRIVRDTATADELLQETFFQVWQKAGEFSGRGAAAAWLYRIARNKSLDQLRRQKARPQSEETESEEAESTLWDSLPSDNIAVEQDIVRRWDQQYLRQALAQLPAEQRLCLELAYFEGMSQQRIADHTNTPLGTVKTRLRSGLEKLERIFRAAGYQVEDIGS
jgi:RNA polymerase sigma-70 factor (ECF subfamily)